MKILSEKPVCLAEVSEMLADVEKRYADEGIELTYSQKKLIEYIRKFSKIGAKDAREIVTQLSGLNMGLKDSQIIKICDLMPKDVDEMRAIFAKERFKYTEEELKRVLDVVAKYR